MTPPKIERIQLTGIVVVYNEERRLLECLNSISFCEQLIVVDLGSVDRSVEIARQCGAEIVSHEWVPIVEKVRGEAVSLARNDWIIFVDPDEVFPIGVDQELRSLIARDPKLGLISIPFQYYFRGKPLTCTVWGREQAKGRICHKTRCYFSVQVGGGIGLMNGFNRAALSRQSGCVRHYWVDSYRQMFEKHTRYIKHEGEAKYLKGERFSWRSWASKTKDALINNLFNCRGIQGGIEGIFLSTFYAWYVSMSLLSLRKYQKQVNGQGK